jgi:tetratricopeptide (TPR) repeat protein
MLFDLRGRGRRRTIQAIYLSLAVLMGGGLVLFGIGGNTSGGLFDAFKGGNGGGGSADATFNKRLATFEQRARTNPQDAAAFASMAKLRFQLAGTGENFNQTQQVYTDKGKQELSQAATAWERYLALDPSKPDPQIASLMVQAYGQGGLQEYDKAVQALEIVVDSRNPTFQLYAQLAILAGAAKQDRKSQLAEEKALALAPKAQRKDLKAQIDLQKSQLTNTPQSAAPSG